MPNKTFKTSRALLAVELGDIDHKMLQFFNLAAPLLGVQDIAAIHVLPGFEPYLPLPDEWIPESVLEGETQEKEEAKRQLQELITDHLSFVGKDHLRFHIETGEPLKGLLEKAQSTECDLIVIGQETGTTHHDILARNLARYSDHHSLIIPETARTQLRHIMVPIDFSDNSIRALQAALAIQDRSSNDIKITVINVYERPNLMAFKLDKTPEQMDLIIEKNHEEGMAKFLAENFPQQKDKLKTALVRRNRPGVAPYLINYALDEAADMIAIGAKGHSTMEVLFLGSVTEKMLSSNHNIPTLIVR